MGVCTIVAALGSGPTAVFAEMSATDAVAALEGGKYLTVDSALGEMSIAPSTVLFVRDGRHEQAVF